MIEGQNPSTAIKNEVNKCLTLKQQILSDEIDETLILDTLEGETNIHELLLEIEEEIAEHENMAKAVKLRIEELKKREERLSSTADKLRVIVLAAMDKTGIKTIKGDLATITVKPVAPKIIVHNESIIPSNFWKPQDPKLDKKALKEAIGKGQTVEGVEMDNGSITLQIRRA